MKDLGTTRENIMEGPASEKDMPKVTYPKVDLPFSFIADKNVKREQEVVIKIKAKVVGFEDNEWRKVVTFEIKEGELEGHDKKKEEEPSLLG